MAFRFRGISRIVIPLVLLTMVMVPLTGAGQAERGVGDQVELVVWFGRENFIPADKFESFHAKYPNIKVKYDVIPLEQAVGDTLRSARAGQAPDIVQGFNYDILPLGKAGQLLDITPQLDRWKQEDPELYNDVAGWGFEMGKVDGIPSGVGIHGGGRWLAYHKDILDKYGLDVPETWDDVLDVSRVVVANEPNVYGIALLGARQHNPSTLLQIFFAMGGEWNDNDIPQLDSPAGYYLINFYQTLVREGLIHPETKAWTSGEQRAAFISGRALFKMMGQNIFPTLQKERDYGTQWGVAVPPYRPGAEADRKVPIIGFPSYITSQTKHPYEASLVLRYLAEPENSMEVAMRYQPTSTMSAMNDARMLTAQPWVEVFEPWDHLAIPYPTMLGSQDSFEVLKDFRDEIFTNVKGDPVEIAKRYQQKLEAVARK